jgi:uncharacterized protein (TIGR02246 family)
MEPTLDSFDAIASAIASRLMAAWNAADHDAFAAEFTDDADFVNVRGDHHRGRATIGQGHAGIWSTIYAGSTVDYSVAQVRQLAPDVMLVHMKALLQVPAGPLAGQIEAIPSMVVVRDGGEWRIAAFHNTQKASR